MDANVVITRKHLALCRYVDTSRSLKNSINAKAPPQPQGPGIVELRFVADYFNILATWWSMLYVLIEGYKEIGGIHLKIDALLEDEETVDALRLFRNGMFHFQSEPIHDKLTKFASIARVEKWAEDLQAAFEEYVKELFPNIDEMYKTQADITQLPKRTI